MYSWSGSSAPIVAASDALDVETTNSARGDLLSPGAYRFQLYVAAENCAARHFIVEVQYNGDWNTNQDTMFVQVTGFRMKKV